MQCCITLPACLSLLFLALLNNVESQGGRESHLPRYWGCCAYHPSSFFALKMKGGADHTHLSCEVISFLSNLCGGVFVLGQESHTALNLLFSKRDSLSIMLILNSVPRFYKYTGHDLKKPQKTMYSVIYMLT